jgi:hypothetical protein
VSGFGDPKKCGQISNKPIRKNKNQHVLLQYIILARFRFSSWFYSLKTPTANHELVFDL